MHISWVPKSGTLSATSEEKTVVIPATCVVRNRDFGEDPRNERRLHDKSEVVWTYSFDRYNPSVPYMPKTFPSGSWKITDFPKVCHLDDPDGSYLYPLFIFTDAWQMVEEWALDENGGYDHPTGRLVKDIGNGIHYSSSRTTLSCIKITNMADIYTLGGMVKYALFQRHPISLEAL